MFRNFLILLLILALSGCGKGAVNNTQTGTVGVNEPITRAEAARMAALNSYSLEEINKMERKIEFEDTDISKWYDKYINAAYTANFISGVDSEHFAPEEYLSLRQAQFLLDKLKADSKVKLQYAQEDKDKPIPYNIWVTAFEKNMNTEKLQSRELKIYADKSKCKKLGDNFFVTELGLTYYEGYEVLKCDYEINAVVSGNTIAALKSIAPVTEYENMEVAEKGNKYIKIKVPGGMRKFDVENSDAEVGDTVKIEIDSEGGYSIK